MPNQPTLKQRIELLFDSDAVSSEQYEQLKRTCSQLRQHVLQVFSIMQITPDWFQGEQRPHLECLAKGHLWVQAYFDLEYLPWGKYIKEECENCSRRKVSSTDSHGYLMTRNDIDRAGYGIPYMGRPLTKWEKTILRSYLQLLETVERHEAVAEGRRNGKVRPIRVATAS